MLLPEHGWHGAWIEKRKRGDGKMWTPKKKWNDLERKIAALEKEQLSIKKYVDENIKTDEELIEIVKRLRDAIQSLNPLMHIE